MYVCAMYMYVCTYSTCVCNSSCSLLEKQGIDFVKTQEEELEKEFEEMRVSQYSVTTAYTYSTYLCMHIIALHTVQQGYVTGDTYFECVHSNTYIEMSMETFL